MTFKETFTFKGDNSAQFDAGSLLNISNLSSAKTQAELPHTSLHIANLDTTSTIFVFLDDINDQDKPDYVLFPNQQLTVHHDEGVTFQQVVLKNTHATNNISANQIKYRIATVREV